MNREGRYIYDEHAMESEDERVFVPQDVLDAAARLSTRAGGNYDSFHLLLAHYHSKWREEGMEAQKKAHRDAAEEENRWRAEHSEGKAEFRTLDGGVFRDRLRVPRDGYYQRIWKRACRAPLTGIMSITEASMHKTIPIRAYELIEMSANGLPVYQEME